MKPIYLIALSLPFISGLMQDHRKTTPRATTPRKDPAVHTLNMDQNILGADDNRASFSFSSDGLTEHVHLTPLLQVAIHARRPVRERSAAMETIRSVALTGCIVIVARIELNVLFDSGG
ncbi:uncharacterized protein LDX57_002173 [Aspergillus melleus]|uniref:uncharacterized protein n=1 Tax=Aspergillus melleus TaxID=138277 RepID=UPI001E8D8F9E|nr:uncharacterized protein LDX57_002173 [Aspergillus melleus]KAH8424422.1 hypothetical protein LDX57_002173 [Aspergillus melleus]